MNGNKSQFLNTSKAISKWLDEHYVKNYTINDDLTVDANGHVDISNENLERISVKFGNVVGSFLCHNNYLVNLAGSPKAVGVHFSCVGNKLTNLAGSPEIVGGGFYCYNNPLISLFEITNCDFKKDCYFNIDEKNFKQRELIQILKKYYNSERERYELTNHQFQDIIKPQIEKEALQEKLNISKIKIQIKTPFI